MEETTHHHHHHHHHHHKEDGASRFKRKNLLSIHRKKVITKWVFYILCVIAVIIGTVTAILYAIPNK